MVFHKPIHALLLRGPKKVKFYFRLLVSALTNPATYFFEFFFFFLEGGRGGGVVHKMQTKE